MHYINIANGYLVCRLQVWKAKHWETEYIEHFPNHFPWGPWPCHMLGGCRSSLETSVQHDGWHALTDTLGHLIFLSEFFGTILVEIHPFRKKKLQCECRFCIALKNAAVFADLWRPGWGEWWDLLKERLYHSLFSVVIFWRDLQMGGRRTWMQFHEVFDWTPRNPMYQLNTTSRKRLTLPVAAGFDPILWLRGPNH